jgi:hypothetical protein
MEPFAELADSYVFFRDQGPFDDRRVASEVMWFECGFFGKCTELSMLLTFQTLENAARIMDDYRIVFTHLGNIDNDEVWCKEYFNHNSGFLFYPTLKLCLDHQEPATECEIRCDSDGTMIISGRGTRRNHFMRQISRWNFPFPIFSSLHLAMAILRSKQLFARDGHLQYLTFLEALETFHSLTRNVYFDENVFRVILGAYLFDSSFI